MNLEKSENEVEEQLNIIWDLLNQGRFPEAWELVSPLLKEKNSHEARTAANIANFAGCSKLGLVEIPKAKTLLEEGLQRSKAIEYGFGEAFALNLISTILRFNGKFKEALEHSERSRSILENLEDNFLLGHIYADMGACYFDLGQFKKAKDSLEESLRIHRETDNKHALIRTLHTMSMGYYDFGDFDGAIQYAQEAVKLANEIGNEIAAINASLIEGIVLKRQGRLNEAKIFLQNVIQRLREKEESEMVKQLLRTVNFNLGHTQVFLGEYEEAKSIFLQFLDQGEQKDETANFLGSQGLGILALYRGDFEQAARYIRDTISKLSQLEPFSLSLVEELVALSTVYVELKYFKKARKVLKEARSIKIESRYSAVFIKYGEAYLAQANRNLQVARESFQRCLRLASDIGLTEYEIRALFHLANLELFEFRISGSRDSLSKMRMLLEQAHKAAQSSQMPLLSLEIGILNGLACQTNMEFDCSLDFFQQSEAEALRLGLSCKVAEIQNFIHHLRADRMKAMEQAALEVTLEDSRKLEKYIGNVQKIVRAFAEKGRTR